MVLVSATDLDSGPHGKVRCCSDYQVPSSSPPPLHPPPPPQVHYLILKDDSGDAQFFSIDPRSGVIATRASFDREQKASYLIEVQSQDGSESARPGQQAQPNTGDPQTTAGPDHMDQSEFTFYSALKKGGKTQKFKTKQIK